MKNIKISLWSFFFVVSSLWLLADNLWPQPFNYFSFRAAFNQYSGVIAFSAMSLCMVLATRPVWLENWLNGLDKGYRLHKWLGIVALSVSIAHFCFTQGTKWMVGWGWLTRPERKGGGANALDGIEGWLRSLRGVAESVGEWAFYIAVLLMVMALIKRIPYRWFAKLHQVLAVAYLVLVFHAIVLVKFDYWSQPIGWWVAVMAAAGVVSAVIVLSKQIGKAHCYLGKVKNIIAYPQLQSYQLNVEALAWPGHQAGQFVFIHNPADKEKSHPFTIASGWQKSKGSLSFMIKKLGDYTNQFESHFKAGDAIALEGPYGRFDFVDNQQGQIWVAGGIGITPFVARLEQLTEIGGSTAPVTLFYSYKEMDAEFLEQLQQLATVAKVTLHAWYSPEKGHLDGEILRTTVTDWKNCSVWFCGGSEFGYNLRRDLRKHGLSSEQFHQECFEMR